jgi:protein translocase SEC61 complex gamma subunit
MGVRDFLESSRRLLRVTSRPSRTEVWLLVKISFLGVTIVGAIGFMIRILFLFVGLLPTTGT